MSSPRLQARTLEEAFNERDPCESSPFQFAQSPFDHRHYSRSALKRMGLGVVLTSSPIKHTNSLEDPFDVDNMTPDRDAATDDENATSNIASPRPSNGTTSDIAREVKDETICLIKTLSIYVTILINLCLEENYSELGRYIDIVVNILEGLKHLLS